MKHGTILKNMWQPSYDSILLYTGVSGRHAKCLWWINGEFYGMHDFNKNDIFNDREHFPIVGYVDYKKILFNAVKTGMKDGKEET